MNVIKRLTKTMNRLRGVHVKKVDDTDGYSVCMDCNCKDTLIILANFMPVLVHPEDFDDYHYHALIKDDITSIKQIIGILQELLENHPELDEQIELIDNYELLTKEGRKKYLSFIKSLRGIIHDGFFEKNAQELLDWNRHCSHCGDPLFTKEDEMNVVLEFDCPFEAIARLDDIHCKKEIEDMKSAEIHLGYFKQGDDMRHCLDECNGNVVEAMRYRVAGMQADIKYLETLVGVIDSTGRANEFEMDADTHFIGISGPDELIDMLIEKELVEPCEDFEEE